jgi:hypothetical protein
MLYIQRTAGLPFSVLLPLRGQFDALETAQKKAKAELEIARTHVQEAFDHALLTTEEGALRTKIYNSRKIFFNKAIVPPVKGLSLPHDLTIAIAAYQIVLDKEFATQLHYENEYNRLVTASYQHLQGCANHTELQRGLLFSSRVLLQQIPDFITRNPDQFNRKDRHTAEGVLQYVTRMATKTTPLSRLATVDMHQDTKAEAFVFPWENETNDSENRRFKDTIPAEQPPTSKITPNVALLPCFYDVLLAFPAFYNALTVRLNPLVDVNSEQVFRWWYFDGTNEAIQQVAVAPILRFICQQFAENQPSIPFVQLTKIIAEATESDLEKTELYLKELIDTGFLEWNFPETGQNQGWTGKLYQFLGFLEGGSAVPAISEAAFVLQWLRTAARTLPFQPISEALVTQQEALDQVRIYFERYLGFCPPIPAEQLFYEDVAIAQTPVVTFADLENMAAQVAQVRSNTPNPKRKGMRQKIASVLNAHGSMSILDLFEQLNDYPAEAMAVQQPSDIPIGHLVQPFKDDNGYTKFVLNALYPGGGKLFARWLHLFSSDYTEQLKSIYEQYPNLYAFSWYAAFNANIHPELTQKYINLPGGRTAQGVLGTAKMYPDGTMVLLNAQNGQTITFADLGLEDLSSRPVLIQMLLALGQPLLDKLGWVSSVWEDKGDGCRFRPRIILGDMVVERADWQMDASFWATLQGKKDVRFFREIRRIWQEMSLPSLVFVKKEGQKSQFIDLDSPLSVEVFCKLIQGISGSIWIEEMLPIPHGHAYEIAFEYGASSVETAYQRSSK